MQRALPALLDCVVFRAKVARSSAPIPAASVAFERRGARAYPGHGPTAVPATPISSDADRPALLLSAPPRGERRMSALRPNTHATPTVQGDGMQCFSVTKLSELPHEQVASFGGA